jgi:hypothetical protein
MSRSSGPPSQPRWPAESLSAGVPNRYAERRARIAQLVEHLHGKEGVTSSSLVPGLSAAELERDADDVQTSPQAAQGEIADLFGARAERLPIRLLLAVGRGEGLGDERE